MYRYNPLIVDGPYFNLKKGKKEKLKRGSYWGVICCNPIAKRGGGGVSSVRVRNNCVLDYLFFKKRIRITITSKFYVISILVTSKFHVIRIPVRQNIRQKVFWRTISLSKFPSMTILMECQSVKIFPLEFLTG